MKIGIVLSGGGIRGIAHIGFLKALEEMGVHPDYYAGTSVGSIVSVLSSAGYSADEIYEIAQDHQIFKLAKLNWPQLGLGTLEKLPSLMSNYIEHDRFEDLKKPVGVSVTNMTLGRPEVFTKGPLFKVVQASCSIPVLFKPVQINGQYYADGGIMNNLPSKVFRDECDFIIANDLVSGDPVKNEDIGSIFKFAVRTFELAISNNAAEGRDQCDLVIAPERAKDQPVLFTKNIKALFESGYNATMEQSQNIKNMLS